MIQEQRLSNGMAGLVDKLEVSLQLIEALKIENEAFKENFDQLKENYDRKAEKLEGLEHHCSILASEKEALQKQLSELGSYWKEQLDAKTAEIQSLKTHTLTRKELEIIRLQLAAELEQTYEQKLYQFEEEVSKNKEMVFQLRRENELLKQDLSRHEVVRISESQNMIKAHRGEIESFQERIKELQIALDSTSDTERIRQLQRENSEQFLKIEGLAAELEETRLRKDTMVAELEQKDRLHQRRLMEEITLRKSLTVEKETLQTKTNALQDELRGFQRLADDLNEENANLKKEILRTKSMMEEQAHKSALSENEVKMSVLKQQRQSESVISDLKRKIADYERELKTVYESLTESRNKFITFEKELVEKIRAVRDEEQDKIVKIMSERTELEHQVSELQRVIIDLQRNEETCRKEINQEIPKLRLEIRTLTDTNEDLQTQKRNLISEKERLAAQVAAEQLKISELNAAVAKVVSEKDGHVMEENFLTQSIARLEEALRALQRESSKKEEDFDKETEAFSHNMDLVQTQWAREKEDLKARISLLTIENEKLLDLENQAQKQQMLFISKATMLRKKVTNLKIENEKLRATIDAKTSQDRAQMEDLHRKQKDFLALLAEEAVLERPTGKLHG
ncbi:Centrosomal protein of 83 kDa [Blyttiomyces sp. JEL0837]|nr:Centrosomal protein of 83 kDa [Blyttiomyces sp. JEL0837]